ncbi:hypothetical protein G6M04_25715 [Agrobacterium rhizogenes]|uniref:hypothetical protein n=1 Tax=Rhizobium rhizogenes TaxID=359 RepID=UPI0015739046|nr:hypothetical protein [Rhizobium rhizogenes]NTG50790.1 hypothetical protein [Rhizobium rhizogenes]
MKIPAQYPAPESFLAALTQPFDSIAGRRVVEPFGIAWSDAIALDRGLDIYHISAPPAGIHLTFKHEGMVFDHDYPDDGKGPFLLTDCAFWGDVESFESYKGPDLEELDLLRYDSRCRGEVRTANQSRPV